MEFSEILYSIIAFITRDSTFAAILVFSASLMGIRSVSKELRFRSVMSGISEKIDRIHLKNDGLEEYCTKKIALFLEEAPENGSIPLRPTDIRNVERTLNQLLMKSIGASRPLENYCIFLKHCLSKKTIERHNDFLITKNEVFNILIQGLEIIQKQASTIIESPKKIKLENSSPIKNQLRIFTSSKGFNTTPNVEIGPSTKDSTDEALNFYSQCLQRNVSFSNITIFESFFELIRGNHPFCVLMAAEELLVPSEISLGINSLFSDEHIYHAVNLRRLTVSPGNKKYIEVAYANISRGIQISLSNRKPSDILEILEFKGIKTELRKSQIVDCTKVGSRYIVLKFEQSDSKLQFKRNRRELEKALLKNSENLTPANLAKIYIKNAIRFKC